MQEDISTIDRQLTRLNWSRIAIGALLVLLLIFFVNETRSILGSLPIPFLLIAVIAFVLATSSEQFEGIANLILGASMFLLVYQFPQVKEIYADGRIIFVFFFLVLVAIFMKRRRYVI